MSSVSSIRITVADHAARSFPSSPNLPLAWESPPMHEHRLLRLLQALAATLLLAILFFALQPLGLDAATYGAVGGTSLLTPHMGWLVRALLGGG